MKKFILTLIMGVCGCLSTFPQATSLTVDNQSPGWLSSKIGFGDQQTVRELKVSGYLNGTDINFLIGLQSDYSLRELDLSDVHIIKGGEEILIGYYSTSTGGYQENYASIKENDYFYYWLFSRFTKLDKMITPKALAPKESQYVYVAAKNVVLQG